MISNQDYRIITVVALFAMLFGWLALGAALTGLFHPLLFGTYVIASLALAGYFFTYNIVPFKLSGEVIAIGLIILVASVFLSFSVTPTVFSGRDQGSISEAAIRLAQNRQLEFSTPASEEFFEIYGPGKALNFPGFSYASDGRLITHFPPAYIAWIGAFYSLLGIPGLVFANTLLLLFFYLFFYLLARRYLNIRFSLLLLLFAMTSFYFVWFFKFTLTENMALFLLWSGIWFLVMFLEHPRYLFFIPWLMAAGLMAFTRIEGILFLAIGLAVIAWNRRTRDYLKSKSKAVLAFLAILLAFFSFLYLWKSRFFLYQIAKAAYDSFFPSGEGSAAGLLEPAVYIFQIHFLYGLLGFLIVGGLGILIIVKKKRFSELVPLLIILPSFAYLVDSNISSDHPWMLRRFSFSILPGMMLYSVIFIRDLWSAPGKPFAKAAAGSIVALLLVSTLPAFSKYAVFSENKNLLAQTEGLSRNFSEEDLVLVDRLASGDGWSMISGPLSSLFGKNAVYFFNPEDLLKIDRSRFENVYLVVPSEKTDYYEKSAIGNRLDRFDSYSLETKRLEKLGRNDPVRLPAITDVKTEGIIYKVGF